MRCFISNLPVRLDLPQDIDAERWLPTFRDFRHPASPEEEKEPLFRLSLTDGLPEPQGPKRLLTDEPDTDMGRLRLWETPQAYLIELTTANGTRHQMQLDPSACHAQATVDRNDPLAGQVLSSWVRIGCAQAVLRVQGVSVHASAVICQGKAYLFLGKSGTGKSTHARLWLQRFPDTSLLNDDNPIIRFRNGSLHAFGTPWSGKTPCYRNLSYPVGGIVRLSQAPDNRFTPCREAEAFIQLLPSCSAIRHNNRLYNQLCNTLVRISSTVPVVRMECRPDPDAAEICRKRLTTDD